MYNNNNKNLYTESLLDVKSDVKSLSDEVARYIESFQQHVDKLEEYESILGTKDDKESIRRRIKQEMEKSEAMMKLTKQAVTDFKRLSLQRDQAEKRDKLLKRLGDSFDKVFRKYEKITNSIQNKIKTYLAAKHSKTGKTTIMQSFGTENSDQMPEFDEVEEIDLDILRIAERDTDVQEIRAITGLMKDLAAQQAQEIQNQSNDIQVIDANVDVTERATEKAVKELYKAQEAQKKGSKKNFYICFFVVFACSIIIYISWANGAF